MKRPPTYSIAAQAFVGAVTRALKDPTQPYINIGSDEVMLPVVTRLVSLATGAMVEASSTTSANLIVNPYTGTFRISGW
jgi:hypothetical protein